MWYKADTPSYQTELLFYKSICTAQPAVIQIFTILSVPVFVFAFTPLISSTEQKKIKGFGSRAEYYRFIKEQIYLIDVSVMCGIENVRTR